LEKETQVIMVRRLAPVVLLSLAALACAVLPGQPTAIPGSIETSAAATLTALAPTLPPATDTPPPAPTDTAAPPTNTPAPFSCAIAYTDFVLATGAGSVTCLGPDGAPRILATGDRPSSALISTDGALVAYQVEVAEGITELWVVSAEGGDARRLVGADQLPSTDPNLVNSPNHYEWLGDTHTLVFDTRFHYTAGPLGPGEYINQDLWTVFADTGALSELLPAGTAGAFAASPDGQTIAISRPHGLDLVNADGSNFRQNVISYPLIVTYSEYLYKPLPQWGADGTFFNVSVPSEDPMAPDASTALYRVDVDGTVTPLGVLPANTVFGGAINPPRFSPDGRFAVYSLGMPDGSGDVMHLLEFLPAGGVDDRAEGPDVGRQGWGWSPDAAYFAYSIFPDGALGQLFVTGTPAESTTPLAAGLTALRTLEWESGDSLVFLAIIGGGDTWSLYRQSVGGEPVLLAGGLSLAAYVDARD
jgi:hypothetical protein